MSGGKAINGSIRDTETDGDFRVQVRFPGQHLSDRDFFGGNPCFVATTNEAIGIAGVIFRGKYKISACIFNAAGHNLAQGAIFIDAFPGGFGVFDCVTPSRVEQSVEASSSTMGEITAFYQDRLKAAHREIAKNASPGGATTNDEDFSAYLMQGCPRRTS
jgi:hypothetical protein